MRSHGQPGRHGLRQARRKLRVEELPSYGDKHRRTPREGVPHDGGLLQGFSPWIEVSFFSWRVRSPAFPHTHRSTLVAAPSLLPADMNFVAARQARTF